MIGLKDKNENDILSALGGIGFIWESRFPLILEND